MQRGLEVRASLGIAIGAVECSSIEKLELRWLRETGIYLLAFPHGFRRFVVAKEPSSAYFVLESGKAREIEASRENEDAAFDHLRRSHGEGGAVGKSWALVKSGRDQDVAVESIGDRGRKQFEGVSGETRDDGAMRSRHGWREPGDEAWS